MRPKDDRVTTRLTLQQIKLQLMEIENELLDDDFNDLQLQRFGSKFLEVFNHLSPLSS